MARAFRPCPSALSQETTPPSQTAIVSDNKPSEPPVVCSAVTDQLPKCQTYVSRFNYAAAGKIESSPDQIARVASAGVDPSYSYDRLDRVLTMTSPAGTTSYHYDSIYQIVQATHPTPPRPLEQFSTTRSATGLAAAECITS